MEDEKDSGKLKSCYCKNILRRITKISNVELALSFSIRAATWGVFKQTLKNRRKSEKGSFVSVNDRNRHLRARSTCNRVIEINRCTRRYIARLQRQILPIRRRQFAIKRPRLWTADCKY